MTYSFIPQCTFELEPVTFLKKSLGPTQKFSIVNNMTLPHLGAGKSLLRLTV